MQNQHEDPLKKEPDFLEEDLESEPERYPGLLEQAIPKGSFHFVAFMFLSMCIFNLYIWHHRIDFSVSGLSLENGEYWRLISALFAHADMNHLLSNGPLFLIFGWLLRGYFGFFLFPWVSIFLGVLTNWITVFNYDPAMRLLGASGMVYSMVALWVAFYLYYETRFSIPTRVLRVMGFSLVLMFPTTFDPTTSYMAHGVGFLLGLVAAFCIVLLTPKIEIDPNQPKIIE